MDDPELDMFNRNVMYIESRYKEMSILLYAVFSVPVTQHRLQDVYETGLGVLQGGPDSSPLIPGSPVQAPAVTQSVAPDN